MVLPTVKSLQRKTKIKYTVNINCIWHKNENMHTQNECRALLQGVHYVQNGNENLVIAQRHPSERDTDYMLAFIKLFFVRRATNFT